MILGAIANGIAGRIQSNRALQQQKLALGVLDKEEQELNSLFNANYYSDYMRRADIQEIIKSAKKFQMDNIKRMQDRAIIMGGTGEFIGAAQKNEADSMASLHSDLNAQSSKWKDNMLNSYLNRKADINNRRFSIFSNGANNYFDSSSRAFSNIGNSFDYADRSLSNMLMGGISKKLGY